MKFKIWIAMAAVMTALLLTANVALASVTFDPNTGIGFVGKGDVQVPWGWNNQTLQVQASNVTFSSTQDQQYAVTCEFDTGTIHVVHHVINKSVSDTVAYDVNSATRNNPRGNVTGFNLTGYTLGSGTETGSVPAVGDACPGNSDLGLVTSATLTATTSSLSASDAFLSLGPTVIWTQTQP